MVTEYAFILTAQRPLPGGNGFNTFTFEGAYKVSPGATRRMALAEIMGEAKKHYGIAEGVAVNIMFFSLEPNRLGGA